MIRLRAGEAGEGKNVKFKLYISFIKKSFINFLLKFCLDVCCHVDVCQNSVMSTSCLVLLNKKLKLNKNKTFQMPKKCDILTNNYLRYNFST